jgi:tetratricopeptide (TPR) repeat protein
MLTLAFILLLAQDTAQLAGAADRALAGGRYGEAEQAFEQLRRLTPGVAEIHAKLGVAYFQQRKFSQAIPALDQALKLKPGLANAAALRAMSLAELGRFGEAITGLEAAFKTAPDPALKRMAGLQLERAYTGLQRDREAAQVALEMNRLYPDDAEVLYHSSRLLAHSAYQTLRQLAQAAPDSLWRRLAAGEAFESQGNYDSALREYEAVLVADPGRSGIHFRMGRVLQLRAEKDPAQAAAIAREFELELAADPLNANAAYELGEMARQRADPAAARRWFEQALRSYPDFAEAHLGLSAVLLAQEERHQALAHAQKAVALNRQGEAGYYRLAQALRALGRTAEQQKAMAEFQRLRTAHKGNRMIAPAQVTPHRVDNP